MALWLVSAFVVGALVLARHRVRGADPRPALTIDLAGHVVGALIATAILPQFAAITALIVVADIQLNEAFVGSHRRSAFRYVAASTIAVIGLLSMQRWTHLAQHAPPWLLLSFLIGHGAGTCALVARQSWEAIRLAHRQGEQLADSRVRLDLASVAARRSLAELVYAGPRAALARLARLAHGLSTMPAATESDDQRAQLAEALSLADRVVRGLREIGRGLYPPELSRLPLDESLAMMRWADDRTGPKIDCRLDPEPSHELRQTIADLAAELAAWAQTHDGVIDSIRCCWHGTDLDIDVMLTSAAAGDKRDALHARLDDVASAAGGETQLVSDGNTIRLFGRLPRDNVVADAQSLAQAAGLETLRPALRDLRLVAAGGLVAIAIAFGVHHTQPLMILGIVTIAVAALISLARRELDRGRGLRVMVLVCAENAVAAGAATIVLPSAAPIFSTAAALPLLIAPSVLTRRQVVGVTLAQQATLALILSLSVLRPSSQASVLVPRPIQAMLLVTALAIFALIVVRTTRSLALALDSDNALLRAARTELVRQSRERRRELERNLHDGAQQSAVAVAVTLRLLLRDLDDNRHEPSTSTDELVVLVDEADRALVEFSDGSYPAVLVEDGLERALRKRARRCPQRTTVSVTLASPLPPAIEEATYYCCAEALQNVSKHAGPTATAHVTVVGDDEVVTFEVSDTGMGFDGDPQTGSGLSNLRSRVSDLRGDIEVISSTGNGCIVRGRLALTTDALVATSTTPST